MTQSVDETIQLVRISQMNPNSASKAAVPGVCSSALAEPPWNFDTGFPQYGPGASMADAIPAAAPVQGGLPAEYRTASAAELDLRIRAAKHSLGDRVVLLGHF